MTLPIINVIIKQTHCNIDGKCQFFWEEGFLIKMLLLNVFQFIASSSALTDTLSAFQSILC